MFGGGGFCFGGGGGLICSCYRRWWLDLGVLDINGVGASSRDKIWGDEGDDVEDGVKVMILKMVVFWVWFRRWWGFGLLGLDHLVVFSNLYQWR
ncbi:hypothetical protein QYF36_009001 [Acer negundo]|nr:hypothetical protein QYF36_009001 [Acer negundo]